MAINYYFDPSSTEINEKGTIELPWKTFEKMHTLMKSFRGGDTIFFKRGEIFFEKLDLTCHGTAKSPIVFTSYGSSNQRPLFMYKSPVSEKIIPEPHAIRIHKSSYLKFEHLEISDDHINPLDHGGVALIKIAFSIDESSFIHINECKISLVGIGVNMIGDHNVVENCRIENLRMVYNTDGGYDDYGANPVVLAGSHNIIRHCYFKDCWALSYDFGYDGGAIEVFGANSSNNRIVHNIAIHCNGFMEFGSSEGGSSNNNYVGNNLIINCGDLLYVNNEGPYAINIQNLVLENNIVIQSIEQLTRPKYLMGMAAKPVGVNLLTIKNNIFWVPMAVDIVRKGQFEGDTWKHTDNTFYLEGGKLNFDLHSSEILLDKNAAIFKQKPLADILGQQISFFPIKYLLKYWQLFF